MSKGQSNDLWMTKTPAQNTLTHTHTHAHQHTAFLRPFVCQNAHIYFIPYGFLGQNALCLRKKMGRNEKSLIVTGKRALCDSV